MTTEKSFEATIEYAKASIRGAFLINSGSAIALMAFLGKESSQLSAVHSNAETPALSISLVAFGIGVLAAVICNAFSYVSQGYFTRDRQDIGGRLRVLAILAFVGSIGCYLWGMLNAYWFFNAIGI